MTIVNFNYNSSMAYAPVLNGVAGAGVGWLDCVLTTGFNAKSVTSLVRTGTTCTLELSSLHGFLPGDIIGIYGASDTWNNLYIVTGNPDSTHITFETTTTPTSPATGTITVRYPPVGAKLSSGNIIPQWEIQASGNITNKRIYRSLDVTGTRWYLRVDDTNAKYMTVSMLEGFTTADSGLINQYDVHWVKSSTADATPRKWIFIGDSKRFFPWIQWATGGMTTSDAFEGNFFGDIIPSKPGDVYYCGINGSTSTGTSGDECYYTYTSFHLDNSTTASALMRSYTQLGSQVAFKKLSYLGQTNNHYGYNTTYPYPNAADSGTYLTKCFVFEGVVRRGTMPAVRQSWQNIQGALASFDKSVVKDGHVFMYIRILSSSIGQIGGMFMDITPDLKWS